MAGREALRAVVVELRRLLEGSHDKAGNWQPGDLERRLAELGVWRDREKAADEIVYRTDKDRAARRTVDAWIRAQEEAGVERKKAVGDFVRASAYAWANRLVALRCLEARGIIDEVVLQKTVYGDRSLRHQRLARAHPELVAGDDGGLFTLLQREFVERAKELPGLFEPDAPEVALRPSVAALQRCVALLSGALPAAGKTVADEDFTAPDAPGWAYQYWNLDEKNLVFERARTKKGKEAKIEGADIVPATCIYTEPYMVRFLVQNALGATWKGMRPESKIDAAWAYYVRDADRASVERKPVADIKLLDPACGSGHFLVEAFDLFYAMYLDEGEVTEPADICRLIFARNLHGVDIDPRAVQLAALALFMKAREKAPDFVPTRMHLAAARVRIPRGAAVLDAFLEKHPEDAPLRPALGAIFDGLAHADELGSLLQIEGIVAAELGAIKQREDETKGPAVDQVAFAFLTAQPGLPAAAEPYPRWQARTLERLHAHLAEYAHDEDLMRSFFGRAVERGLSLIELLTQRYDVVTANPPYMGSKNMGPVVRTYVEAHYPAGKRDLYAAFILRCRDLLEEGGRCAIVAPQAWLFLSSYADMRVRRVDATRTVGLFAETRLEVVAQLGRHAFSEADPPGNVALFVLRAEPPPSGHRPTCIRLALPRPAQTQAELLQKAADGQLRELTWRPAQTAFLQIAQSPLCYWLRPRFLQLLAGKTFAEVGEVRQGLATADDGRFLRFAWEIPLAGARWFAFYKGGGYRKWDGFAGLTVDWEDDGARLSAFSRAVVRNPNNYFHAGWTYSRMARGRMGVRLQSPSGVIADKGPGIYLRDERYVAALNARVFSHVLRALSPNMAFEVDVVARGPVPSEPPEVDVAALVAAKARLTATDLTERSFEGVADLAQELAWSAELHALEGAAERAVAVAYGLDDDDVAAVCADTGTPAGWLSTEVTPAQRARLRELFALGPGAKEDDDAKDDADGAGDDEGDDESAADGATGRPIQPETFLEALCEKVGIAPAAAWRELKEGLAAGWHCAPELRRITLDRVSELVLRLLGHRWPREVERGDPLPKWARADGLLAVRLDEATPLADAVIERLADPPFAAWGLTSAAFDQATGVALHKWLARDFFKAHASQFARRPVVWQLQSTPEVAGRAERRDAAQAMRRASTRGPHAPHDGRPLPLDDGKKKAKAPPKSTTPSARGGAGDVPMMACLVHCHRVDGDLLPRIRTQMVAVARQRMATERRGLESLAERTAEQEARLFLLRQREVELARFDAALDAVSARGFDPHPSKESAQRENSPRKGPLWDHAVDDASLQLTARWLGRFEAAVAEHALPGWRAEAEAAALDPSFATWVVEALTDLPRFCARVRPSPKTFAGLGADPAAADFARVLAPSFEAMASGALAAACEAWREKLSAAVLDPLQEGLKATDAEVKALTAEHATPGAAVSEARHREIKARLDVLKAQGKHDRAELKRVKAGAESLQRTITAWRCAGMASWEPWLAGQPLYDQLSAPDGTREPPASVAAWVAQESRYVPDPHDGVRVNLAPLQREGLLAAPVLAAKDVEKAIADRAQWRADERRWCRERVLPQPGWWAKTPKQEAAGLHRLAWRLDVAAADAREVESLYERAIALDGADPLLRGRHACFLLTRGRTHDAQSAWARAAEVAGASDRAVDDLHVPVALLALHRAQLDLARAVLDGVPASARASHEGLRAIERQLLALAEVRRVGGAAFPLSVPHETWWRGPHLERPAAGAAAPARWLPGSITGVDEEAVHLFAADPPGAAGGEPTYGFVSIPRADFDRWSRDERAEALTEGRFVELVWRTLDAEPVIRVHRDDPWVDPALPVLPADPLRYLRREGWVR